MKILGIAFALALVACGGSKNKQSDTTYSNGSNAAIPTTGDGGEPLPPPDGQMGNPNDQMGSASGPKSNQP